MNQCTCDNVDYAGCPEHPWQTLNVFEKRTLNILVSLLEETKKNNEELRKINSLLKEIHTNTNVEGRYK